MRFFAHGGAGAAQASDVLSGEGMKAALSLRSPWFQRGVLEDLSTLRMGMKSRDKAPAQLVNCPLPSNYGANGDEFVLAAAIRKRYVLKSLAVSGTSPKRSTL